VAGGAGSGKEELWGLVMAMFRVARWRERMDTKAWRIRDPDLINVCP
jgi:hypothetical protein